MLNYVLTFTLKGIILYTDPRARGGGEWRFRMSKSARIKSNKKTKEGSKKKMRKAVINSNRCDKSPFCPVKRVCPVNAVTQKVSLFGSSVPVIDEEKCISCGKCVTVCPMRAVSMA